MKNTPKPATKYFVGRMVINGEKVVRVMRRRIELVTKRSRLLGRIVTEKVAIFELASASWIKPPAKFVQASNLFDTRAQARREKKAWEGKMAGAK